MKDHLKQIYRVLTSYIDISEEEWSIYSPKLIRKEIRKNEMLLHSGEICKYIFFVNRGLLRVFFTDQQAAEHSFHFAMENTFATDYESFLKKARSHYAIEALENTEVIMISYEVLQEGYTLLRFGEKLGRRLAEEHLFQSGSKIRSYYTQTPLERYHTLNQLFPGITQRVPQRFIASYLHISSVHLSRLKNA